MLLLHPRKPFLFDMDRLVYLKGRPKLKPYMFYGLLEPGANLYVTALDIMSTSWMFH